LRQNVLTIQTHQFSRQKPVGFIRERDVQQQTKLPKVQAEVDAKTHPTVQKQNNSTLQLNKCHKKNQQQTKKMLLAICTLHPTVAPG
jgi:hypothetical protein